MRINRPHHNNMQNRMKKPVVPCEALRNGVAALSYAAAATYGTGKTIQYRSKDGSYVSTASFAEILKEASFEDASMARAAAALSQADVPEQGVKTALIMLNALLELFYIFKNETNDKLSDDELLSFMKKSFDGDCFGSLELLAGRDFSELRNRLFKTGESEAEKNETQANDGEEDA